MALVIPMFNKQKGYDEDHLRRAIQLSQNKIDPDEYLRIRLKEKKSRWFEMKKLVKDFNLFTLYINALPYNYRPKALKEVHGLTNIEIRNMRESEGFSGSLDNYLSGRFSIDNTSRYLFELAIILDVPIDFLQLEAPIEQSASINSFSEYKKVNNIIYEENIYDELSNRPMQRFIKGFMLVSNKSISTYRKHIRIDKRIEYYTFEVFCETYIEALQIECNYLLKLLPGSVRYVLWSRPLLRWDFYKVSFYGIYDDHSEHLITLEEKIKELINENNAQALYSL